MKPIAIALLTLLALSTGLTGHFGWALASLIAIIVVERRL